MVGAGCLTRADRGRWRSEKGVEIREPPLDPVRGSCVEHDALWTPRRAALVARRGSSPRWVCDDVRAVAARTVSPVGASAVPGAFRSLRLPVRAFLPEPGGWRDFLVSDRGWRTRQGAFPPAADLFGAAASRSGGRR